MLIARRFTRAATAVSLAHVAIMDAVTVVAFTRTN